LGFRISGGGTIAKTWQALVAVTLLLGDGGCGEKPEVMTRQVVWESEEGFHDLVLPVNDVIWETDGGYSVVAGGVLDGQELGLTVRFRGGMKPGVVENELDDSAFYQKGVTLVTDARNGAALVAALSRTYGVVSQPAPLRSTVELTSFALAGDPRRPNDSELRFKVFHDDREERGEYYEWFVNLDLARKRLVLKEKDPEYRENILRGFGCSVPRRPET